MTRSNAGRRQRFQIVAIGDAGRRVVEPLRADSLFARDGRGEVRFAAVHTDLVALEATAADRLIHVNRPRPDRLALPRDEDRWRSELEHEIHDADLVLFVVAESEIAALEIAATCCRVARQRRDCLTVAFDCVRGVSRGQLADDSTARLIAAADSVFVVPAGDSPVGADREIRQAIRALVQITRVPGLINYSLKEIADSLRGAGLSQLATGRWRGSLGETARLVLERPTLFRPLIEARACFLHARTPPGISLFDLSQLSAEISAVVDPEANVWLNAHPDPSFEDEFEVTLFAAGLPMD